MAITDLQICKRLEQRYQSIMAQQRRKPIPRPDPNTTVEMDHEAFDSMVLIRRPVK
jgi:hypothetical protein